MKQTFTRKQKAVTEQTTPGVYRGFWKLSFDNNKLEICPQMKKLLALSKCKDPGLTEVLPLLIAPQLFKLIRAYRRAIELDNNLEVQIRLLLPCGKPIWLRVTGILHYRRWGKAAELIGSVEDITQKVKEDSLGLSVINHELRNPLTIIKLNTQRVISMLAGQRDQYPVNLLKSVDLHINGITGLLDDYLVHSVDEQRVPQFNLSVFDLDQLLEEIIHDIRSMHRTHRFIFEKGEKIWVKADRYKILQVCLNYLTNAIKFSPPASAIVVTVARQNGMVQVAVRDHGTGIPYGQEKVIFNKFYSSAEKAIRHHNSKGLGLYLVSEIISAHGGQVRAAQAPEGGAIFSFFLPFIDRNF